MRLELPQLGDAPQAGFAVGGALMGVIGLVGDQTATLTSKEERHVANAVAKRRREYAAGRSFARAALGKLGRRATDILTGSRREPIWPPGVIGSIAHSDTYALAVVAHEGRPFESVGVDIEALGRLTPDLSKLILTPQEQAWLRDGGEAADPTLVFSAKEAVFKAINPLAGLMIGFDEVEIHRDRYSGGFQARYIGSVAVNRRLNDGVGITARFGDHVVSLFVIAPPAPT